MLQSSVTRTYSTAGTINVINIHLADTKQLSNRTVPLGTARESAEDFKRESPQQTVHWLSRDAHNLKNVTRDSVYRRTDIFIYILVHEQTQTSQVLDKRPQICD